MKKVNKLIDTAIFQDYINGHLSNENRQRIEHLAKTHPSFQQLLKELKPNLKTVTDIHKIIPHPSVKARMLCNMVDHTFERKNTSSNISWTSLLSAFGLGILLAASIASFMINKVNHQHDALLLVNENLQNELLKIKKSDPLNKDVLLESQSTQKILDKNKYQ